MTLRQYKAEQWGMGDGPVRANGPYDPELDDNNYDQDGSYQLQIFTTKNKTQCQSSQSGQPLGAAQKQSSE